MNCRGNPTCAITCVALCCDAIRNARTANTSYLHALELIIRSQPPREKEYHR